MKKTLIIILAAVLLLSLAACAKAPGADPTTDPTPAAPAAYAGEDTFVISRDGEDFVINSAGLGVTVQEVCEAYGVELEIGADPINAVAAAVPPVGGDIRFGMSYAEVAERLTGVKQEREPSMTLSSRYVNSYAGALTRMRFQFDVESDRLYLMGLDFMTDDPAAEWFALYEKFTEAFGEPDSMSGEALPFQTPEELKDYLSDVHRSCAVVWSGETKGMTLEMHHNWQGELYVCVEMKWLELMPGFAAVQQAG